MEAFRELGIVEPILETIKQERFTEPSEIQRKAVPLILEGKDVIAGSATGSGKTLAFATGIIQNTEKGKGIQALILVPTRELAEQVSSVFKKFSKHKELRIVSVYGGVSIIPQIRALETADIIIGTPGRLLDHMQRKTVELHNVRVLVLDEADRMLDMGFIEDAGKIINECPKNRQTLLFSATISSDVVHISKKYMNNPVEVEAKAYVDPTKLKQIYYDVDEKLKFSLLYSMLKIEKPELAMIFCNTRITCGFVAKNLTLNGIKANEIHGGLSQEKRNHVLKEFHLKKASILVCTDVAARGLDIKGVSHIYNYNIPREAKDYIHRIGRTARAGKEGKIVNLLTGKDYDSFRKLDRFEGINIEKEQTPQIERVMIKWMPKTRSGGGKRRFGSGGGRGGGQRGRWQGRSNGRSGGSRFGSRDSGGKKWGDNRSSGHNNGDRRGGQGRSYGRGGQKRFGDNRNKSYGGGHGRSDDRRSGDRKNNQGRSRDRRDGDNRSGNRKSWNKNKRRY